VTTDVRVPDIGDFSDVAVIEVLVKPGDTVAVEQSLITIESDKASMEIPSSHAGVVKELKVAVGDKVEVGQPGERGRRAVTDLVETGGLRPRDRGECRLECGRKQGFFRELARTPRADPCHCSCLHGPRLEECVSTFATWGADHRWCSSTRSR